MIINFMLEVEIEPVVMSSGALSVPRVHVRSHASGTNVILGASPNLAIQLNNCPVL